MKFDPLGDRMKDYERTAIKENRLRRYNPFVVRLDGRTFSKFTKFMERPFDVAMTTAMRETTTELMQKFDAVFGYVQSDEITLVFNSPNDKPVIFDGKIQKILSVFAGQATALFIKNLSFEYDINTFIDKAPHFDARIIPMPTKVEVANNIIWRSQDAKRNAVSMAARDVIGHSRMQNLNVAEMKNEMMKDGYDFDQLPNYFKFGNYIRRETVTTKWEDFVLENDISEKAKAPESGFIERSVYNVLDIGYIGKYENRVGIIYDGEEPILKNCQN